MKRDLARQFFRAAAQRLGAAEALIREQHTLDAIYLAGYGVECALKALLLSRIPSQRHAALASERFRGLKGHNLESLKKLLEVQGASMPLSVAESFRRVAGWSTQLRYEVGRRPLQEAESFVRAAIVVLDWARRSR